MRKRVGFCSDHKNVVTGWVYSIVGFHRITNKNVHPWICIADQSNPPNANLQIYIVFVTSSNIQTYLKHSIKALELSSSKHLLVCRDNWVCTVNWYRSIEGERTSVYSTGRNCCSFASWVETMVGLLMQYERVLLKLAGHFRRSGQTNI